MQGGGTGSAGNGPRALEPKHLLTVLLRGRMATGASFLCRHQQPLQCQSRRLLLPLCTARRLLLPPGAAGWGTWQKGSRAPGVERFKGKKRRKMQTAAGSIPEPWNAMETSHWPEEKTTKSRINH